MRSFVMSCFAALSIVPAANAIVRTWDGEAGTLMWNAPANWNPNGVPTAADDAVVNVAGDPITITLPAGTWLVKSLSCNQTLHLTNPAVLIPANASSTSGFHLEGILRGAGNLTITSNLKWMGGGMEGTGSTIVGKNATFTLEDGLMNTFLRRPFYNLGTGAYLDGLSFVDGTFVNHGNLTVGNGRTFQLITSNGSGLNNTFVNHGTLHKLPLTDFDFTAFSGNVMRFDNNGTVIIDEGEMTLMSGTSSGHFQVNEGGLLTLAGVGPHAMTDTASIIGEGSGWWNIHFSNTFNCQAEVDLSGSVFLNGSSTFAKAFSAGELSCINNGTVNFNGPVTLAPGANHQIEDITLNFNSVDPPSYISGFFDHANIGGPGVVHVNADSTFIVCGFPNNLHLIIDEGVTADNVGTGTSKSLTGKITNHGQFVLGQTIQLANGTIENFGEFIAPVGSQGTDEIRGLNGTNAFINHGTINKTQQGLVLIGNGAPVVQFANDGVINIEQGTFTISDPSVNTGTINIGGPALLRFVNNSAHDAASIVAGAGQIDIVGGVHQFNGQLAVTGNIEINANNPPTVTIAQSSPDLDVFNDGLLILPTSQQWRKLICQSNGTVDCGGDMSISEFCHLVGRLTGNGVTTTAPNCTLSGGGNSAVLERTFIHNGTASLTGGIAFKSGTFINNGSIALSGTATFRGQTGTNVFENHGTLTKSGSATSMFTNDGAALPFMNHGLVDVTQGTLQMNSGGEGAGAFTIKPGATLRFGFDYSASEVLVQGTLTIAQSAQLLVNGSYVQSSTGQLHVNPMRAGSAPLLCANDANIDGVVKAICTSLPPPFTTFTLVNTVAGEIVGEFDSQLLVPPGELNYALQHVSFTTFAHGDSNGDGAIDITDLLLVMNGWGNCPQGCAADLNASGAVNVDDLILVILNWS